MKTVAVVSALERHSGSTIAALIYRDSFRRLGYDPHWYQCVPDHRDSDYYVDGTVVRGVSTGHRATDIALNSRIFYPKRAAVFQEDLVFLTDPLLLGLARANRNSLVLVHDLREFHPAARTNRLAPMLYSWLFQNLRYTKGAICVTNATRAELRRRFPASIPESVVYSCSHLRPDGKEHIRNSVARLGMSKQLRVGYVAVDRPYKRVRHVIDLASRLDLSHRREFTFTILSKLQPLTQAYLNRLTPRNLAVVPAIDDLSTFYADIDVLVYPSEFEGFGRPLLEAMNFGIPIVASSAAAVREVVGPGGFLIEGYGEGAWRDALESLTNPDVYERWANLSLARAERFSEASFDADVAQVLSQVAAPS